MCISWTNKGLNTLHVSTQYGHHQGLYRTNNKKVNSFIIFIIIVIIIIISTCPDRHWGPPSLLYNGNRVFFPRVKQPGRGLDHPPPSNAEIKERVELYLYSPSGLSWPAIG